jgi:hypothetical protein
VDPHRRGCANPDLYWSPKPVLYEKKALLNYYYMAWNIAM